MTAGIHPTITFDKNLAVGQEIETRLGGNSDRALRFPARIVGLDETTARVEAHSEKSPGASLSFRASPHRRGHGITGCFRCMVETGRLAEHYRMAERLRAALERAKVTTSWAMFGTVSGLPW